MANSPLLTKDKQAWADQFKPNMLRGQPIVTNAGVLEWYGAELQKLAAQLAATTQREVLRLFEREGGELGYSQDASIASQSRIILARLKRRLFGIFDDKAQKLASGMLAKVDRATSANLHSSLKELSGGLSLKTTAMPAPLQEAMKATLTENVRLIRSIAQEHHSKVESAVYRSITSGNGLQDLVPELEKIGGVTRERARIIADDQTKKATSAMAKHRMEAVGIKKFQWLHSGGSQEPRNLHKARYPEGLNGGIYFFDDPPIIDERTGTRGLPGYLNHCRCRMVPVIDFNQGDGGQGA